MKRLLLAVQRLSRILTSILPRNYLDKLARKYGTDKRTNDGNEYFYHGYVQTYHQLFQNKRNSYKNILEIGVREGWSHKMWHDYFFQAKIYGIDNYSDPVYEHIKFQLDDLENDRLKIFIGDQADPLFLNKCFKDVIFDVVIDDGSHRSWHQQKSFKHLFARLKSGGYYIIEDLGVCQNRDFREFDDVRSSTLEWLKSIQRGKTFSYYMNEDESKGIHSAIHSVRIIGELGIILKR